METLLPQLLHTYAFLLPPVVFPVEGAEPNMQLYTASRCEQNILVSTSVLCHVVRMVQSPSLLEQLLHFLLRTPSLMEQLLRRCDHVSEQVRLRATPTKPGT